MKLEVIADLHYRVLHGPDRHDPALVSDTDHLKETKIVAKCSDGILTLVCKKCFGDDHMIEAPRSRTEEILIETLLAKHHLRWLTKPYRVVNKNGDVVMAGPQFDMHPASIAKAVETARKARAREQ